MEYGIGMGNWNSVVAVIQLLIQSQVTNLHVHETTLHISGLHLKMVSSSLHYVTSIPQAQGECGLEVREPRICKVFY